MPAHWQRMRIKHLADLRSGQSITSEAIDPDGEYPVYGGNGLRGYTSSFTHDGQFILIGRQGALCGNINYADGQFWASEHAVVVRPVQQFERFWFGELLRHIDLNQYSISAAQPGLAVERIRNLEVPVPPLHEQASISRYLRHATRNVAALIRNKRRLIALLNEEKQAIIQQVVTRGLDPEVPLKPSGVEWLREIPAHWAIKRNGAIFDLRKEPGNPTLPILEVSLRTGVTVRDVLDPKRKQMMSDLAQYQTAHAGDVAYNMMRMWQGAVGVVPVDGLVSPAYVVVRPRLDTDGRYFSLLYRTQPYMREVDKFSRGIVKDRNRLYWADFKQMPVVVPPFREQVRIVDHLADRLQAIDSVISRANREIDLIREYRTRLIADVVTGQLDVREAAASLPNIEDTEVDSLLADADDRVEDDDLLEADEALDLIESADAAD